MTIWFWPAVKQVCTRKFAPGEIALRRRELPASLKNNQLRISLKIKSSSTINHEIKDASTGTLNVYYGKPQNKSVSLELYSQIQMKHQDQCTSVGVPFHTHITRPRWRAASSTSNPNETCRFSAELPRRIARRAPNIYFRLVKSLWATWKRHRWRKYSVTKTDAHHTEKLSRTRQTPQSCFCGFGPLDWSGEIRTVTTMVSWP